MTGPRTRTRRLFASAAALAIAATGVAIAAPSAEAAPAPRTYTAVMTPVTAAPGVEQTYSVVVKNTSTNLSTMDRFILQIPAGFTVIPVSVTAPRGGWTAVATTSTVTASTSQAIKYGLRKTESMKVTFKATDTVVCDSGVKTWVQKGDGAIIDPWVAQSPNPTVTVTPVADRFVITSVSDVDLATAGKQVVKGDPITVSGDFRCGPSLVAPAGAAGQLDAVLSSQGTPANSGALGGIVNAAVNAGDTTKTLAGPTYSAVASGVGVTLNWSGGAGDAFNIDVLGAAQSVTGSPGSPINPELLTVSDGVANLGAGAKGPVAITIQACVDQTGIPCSGGTELSLSGSFKDLAGNPLYGYGTGAADGIIAKPTDGQAPASLTRICSNADCAHRDGLGNFEPNEGGPAYNYNFACTTSCEGYGLPFGEREVEEDFLNYPTFVSLKKADGSYTPFKLATRCVALPTSNSDPNKAALLAATRVGKIETYQAQLDGFCVDVNAINRAGNSFTGALSIPVLFVEDPRLRP